MLKRILTLSLSVMMLTSLCPTTSVFATDTKPAAVVEDFEDGEINSDIANIGTANASVQIATDKGKNGGKALEISLDHTSGYVALGFDKAYNQNSDIAVISYDFQISQLPQTMPSNGSMVYLAGVRSDVNASALNMATLTDSETGNAKFSFVSQTVATAKHDDIVVGEWYKIIAVRLAGVYEAWAIDSNGNVAGYNKRTGAGSGVVDFCLVRSGVGALGDGKILIDNVEFSIYDKTLSPSMINSSIKNGAENLPLNTKSITLSFDAEISERTITIETSGGAEVTCSVSGTKDSNEKDLPMTYATVSWTENLLSDTTYTLVVRDAEGNQISDGSITFKTLNASKPHLWKDITISTVAQNTENSAKTDISFKIEDFPEYANTSFTGAVMAVILRNGQMADFDIIADTFTADTSITKTFGFTATNGDTLQLIQMDTANGLTPLAWAEYPVE